MTFVDAWRRSKSAAFSLPPELLVEVDFWGARRRVYANANLSVYSAQTCNARCAFCVEELRPASRGRELAAQRRVEADDDRYFAALERVLDATRALSPSVSVTGGEPSKDVRLPRILRTLADAGARKRTLTTNGSGLLDVREGRTVLDWIVETGVQHLNVSRAHPDGAKNAKLMRYDEGPTVEDMRAIVARANAAGTRVRLSCVLVDGSIDSLEGIRAYLEFARSIGVDNVVFRQLMQTDPRTVQENFVVRFSDRKRTRLEPLLDAVSAAPDFAFTSQVVGYYYYVEVWRWDDAVDVVFEEADLARLEETKRLDPETVHELIFHPSAELASTWQPWDGVLGPR